MKFYYTLAVLFIASYSQAATDARSGNHAFPLQVYHTQDLRHWQAESLYDLLLRLPGVSVQQSDSGQEHIQLHGMSNAYLALLIDGHPMAGNNINNSRSARNIPATLVEKIEVSRSGRADLDARGGAAGTINVILQQQAGQPSRWRMSLGGSPLNSSASLKSQIMPDEKTQLQLVTDVSQIRFRIRGEDTTAQEQDNWQSIHTDKAQSLQLSYQKQIDQQSPLKISALYFNNEEQERNKGRSDRQPSRLFNQKNQFHSARLKSDLAFRWLHFNIKTFALAEQFKEKRQLAVDVVRFEDNRWQLGSSLEEAFNEHQWQAGFNYRQMHKKVKTLQAADVSANLFNFDVNEDSFHLFGLDRWQLTSNTLFEAGFRMETYRLRQKDLLSTGTTESTGDTHWLPSFHLLHQYDEQIRLRFNSSQSARQPELEARIPYKIRQKNTELRGNGQLDAEVVSSLSMSYEFQSNNTFARLHEYSITLFQHTINNAILPSSHRETDKGQTITVVQQKNSEVSTSIRGVDINARFHVGSPSLTGSASLGLYHSSIRASEERPAQQLPHQPEYAGQFSLNKTLNSWDFGGQWRYQGKSEQRPINLSNATPTLYENHAGHTLDLYAKRRFKSLTLYMGASRLLTDDWRSQSATSELKYHRETLWKLSLGGHF